jgi:hypothetical protein
MFESARPGLLASLVSQGELASELSADPNKFARSKALIGGVYFNTHASVQELKRRLKKIASRAGISDADYAFVISGQLECEGKPDA